MTAFACHDSRIAATLPPFLHPQERAPNRRCLTHQIYRVDNCRTPAARRARGSRRAVSYTLPNQGAPPMNDTTEPFEGSFAMYEYANARDLDYAWQNTALFEKRRRTLPSDQFEVRPVRTKRGVTMVGLFSAAITRAEREADAPYREAMAAKRLARVARAERRVARSMARKG